ncbi:NnrU family protein [soil metagenome]
MALLIIGLSLWIAAHGFKRALPKARAGLDARLGAGRAKGVIALLIVLSVVLMVLGYRSAPFVALYTPPGWGVHLNNLAMIGAVALLGAGRSKGRARSLLRHPMLAGVAVWGAAHLLVNGTLAALVLFGGLAAWALGAMALVNAREPAWTRPAPGPISGDIRLLVIALVLYAVITAVHVWLGVWPFPR